MAMIFEPKVKWCGKSQVPSIGPEASPKAAKALKMLDTDGDTICLASSGETSSTLDAAESTMLGKTGVQQSPQPQPIKRSPTIWEPHGVRSLALPKAKDPQA